MVTMFDILRCREQIFRLAECHGARRVRVFGSVTRQNQAGDLDLLVRMDQDRSLLDRIALQQDLEDLLGVGVDVVNERAIHRLVRAQILRDAVEL